MRPVTLGLALPLLTVLVLLPAAAADGAWVPVRTEYHALLAVLPGDATWHVNASHGPGDLWTLNLSVSGSGFTPLTVLIADDPAYTAWCATNATTGCLFVAHVNWSLNAQGAFPHAATWHLVLANPFPISLLYSLTVTLYQWHPAATDPTGDLLGRVSDSLPWLLTLALLVFVVIPCVCGCVRRHGHATHYEEVIYDRP